MALGRLEGRIVALPRSPPLVLEAAPDRGQTTHVYMGRVAPTRHPLSLLDGGLAVVPEHDFELCVD
eukprot:9010386-Alexandrium_andersonii.AAC.1